MSQEPFARHEIALAWRRALLDNESDRVFLRHPLEVELVRVDADAWLHQLHAALVAGNCPPQSLTICDAPKGNGAVRPGGLLPIAEQTILAACVGACLPEIIKAVHWSKNRVDFSYHLASDPRNPHWLQKPYLGWSRFRDESLKLVQRDCAYVVELDVVGYYENIDLRTLFSDLDQLNPRKSAVDVLKGRLTTWAQVRGRGIPQGFSASDILGKLYLSRVDMAFAEMGYSHFRYVDDFRIFCRSLSEAKKAIVDLTRLLRRRGLSLNTGKTRILRADEARRCIDGVIPTLRSIRRGFLTRSAERNDVTAAYMSLAKADALLDKQGSGAPTAVLERAYQTFFVDAFGKFDKTLFHFLISRLGRARSRLPLEHCISLLASHPEETKAILEYFADVAAVAEIDDRLAAYLVSEDAAYTYQVAKIIEWRTHIDLPRPSDEFIAAVRNHLFSGTAPAYLKSICRYFLGRFGSLGDLERIEQQYSEASNGLEKSEILCALHRMEKARRNALLAISEKEGELTSRASRLVRGGHLTDSVRKHLTTILATP